MSCSGRGSDEESCDPTDLSSYSDEDYSPSSDDDSEFDSQNNDVPPTKKRRMAKPQAWKKNVRKNRRNSGKSYKNVRGVIKPGKIFSELFDCNCRWNCAEKVNSEQRRNNFDAFYSNASWETQTAVLANAVKVVSVKRKRRVGDSQKGQSREYYLKADSENVRVCKSMFMNTLQVDSARIHRALKKGSSGTFVDRRGKHVPANATSDEALLLVHQHIQSFPKYTSHYERNKVPNLNYLPCDLNLRKMYSLYKETVILQNKSNPSLKKECVSETTYKRIFYRDFNLKFKSPKKDTCKTCDQLKMQIDVEDNKKPLGKNAEELKRLKSAQELHHRQVESANKARENDSKYAKEGKIHAISFDLEKTFPLPKLTTNEAYYKRQLSVFNLGIHDLGTQQAYMYTWHEGIASRGPQEIGSCVMKYVKEYVNSSQMIAWSDACGGQNRNIKIALMWMYLVAQENCPLDVIVHKFCVSGHSYLPNDRDFSQIENKIRRKETIYCFDDSLNIVQSCRQNKRRFQVHRMSSKDFVSTKALETRVTYRKLDEEKQKVNWLKIREIRVEKSNPGVIKYKYSNQEFVPYYQFNIKKKITGPPPCFSEISLDVLYPTGHPISRCKKNDILHLLKYVPPVHHRFYQDLPSLEDDSHQEDGVAPLEYSDSEVDSVTVS